MEYLHFEQTNKKISYHRDRTRSVKWPFKVTQGHLLLCQSVWHI